MESQNENTSQYHIKCKLLKKDVHLDKPTPKALAYTKLKRIYLRGIKQDYYSSTKVPYNLQDKRSICLNSVEVHPRIKSHDLNFVKRCINLKHVVLKAPREGKFPMKLFIPIIKRLPKNIETITVSASNLKANVAELHTFYKTLGSFPYLRFYNNDINTPSKKQSLCLAVQGYSFIKRYLSQLPKLKEIHCSQSYGSQQGFLNYILKDEPCHFMTGLKLIVTEDDGNNNDEDEDEDEYEENNMNDEDGPEAENEERISKIEPFFRFRLFPNLRELELLFSYVDLVPIGSFIAEGFRDLRSLESLVVNFEDNENDYGHFYTALLQLPLLKSFQLVGITLEQNEGELLADFLGKQTQLIYLHMQIQPLSNMGLESQILRECFKDLCSHLGNMPNLKYLGLWSDVWPIENLSIGLQKSNVIDQLEELNIRVYDKFALTSLSPVARVEGLCDFIKRQKRSLRKLNITLGLVKDDEVLDSLINAFSELEELKHFSFTINAQYKIKEYMKNTQREQLKGYPSFKKTFSPLSQALQKLDKLSYLKLELNSVTPSYEKSTINSSVVFNAMLKINHLKHLELRLPYLAESVTTHPAQLSLLSTLRNLDYIRITDPEKGEIQKIEQIIQNAICRQNF